MELSERTGSKGKGNGWSYVKDLIVRNVGLEFEEDYVDYCHGVTVGRWWVVGRLAW